MDPLAIVVAGVLAAEPLVIPPDPQPRWWKGNLHTHTFWSDGNDFPEMIAEWYRDRGWHFLALSDHNTLSQGEKWVSLRDVRRRSHGLAFDKYMQRFGPSWVETRGGTPDDPEEVRLKPFDEYRALVEERGRFLMLPAEEITGGAGNGRAVHMNATNLAEYIEPQEGETVADVIRANMAVANEQAERLGRRIMVHVNHPNYKWGVTAEDLAEVVEERFFEVWNGVDGDGDPGNESYPSTDEIWDIANTLRLVEMNAPPLWGLAADDSHNYHWQSPRAFPGRAWVRVRSTHLTPDKLLEALEAGDFYSSTGVELDSVTFTGSTLSLQIVEEPGETYRTRFIGTRRGVNTTGVARRDADGEVIQTTLDYTGPGTPIIGEVFATIEGPNPSFTMPDDALYIRAVVDADATPEFPSRESLYKRAWTQPMGWRLED